MNEQYLTVIISASAETDPDGMFNFLFARLLNIVIFKQISHLGSQTLQNNFSKNRELLELHVGLAF